MAWYRNTETDIVWEIVGDFEKQISTNPVFKEIQDPTKGAEEVKETEQEINQPTTKIVIGEETELVKNTVRKSKK